MALAPVLLETLGSLPQACDTDIDDFLQQLFDTERPESTPPVTRHANSEQPAQHPCHVSGSTTTVQPSAAANGPSSGLRPPSYVTDVHLHLPQQELPYEQVLADLRSDGSNTSSSSALQGPQQQVQAVQYTNSYGLAALDSMPGGLYGASLGLPAAPFSNAAAASGFATQALAAGSSSSLQAGLTAPEAAAAAAVDPAVMPRAAAVQQVFPLRSHSAGVLDLPARRLLPPGMSTAGCAGSLGVAAPRMKPSYKPKKLQDLENQVAQASIINQSLKTHLQELQLAKAEVYVRLSELRQKLEVLQENNRRLREDNHLNREAILRLHQVLAQRHQQQQQQQQGGEAHLTQVLVQLLPQVLQQVNAEQACAAAPAATTHLNAAGVAQQLGASFTP